MEYVMLKDVCAINMGQSPDSDSYNDNGEGVPFFQGNADFGERYPVTRKWCSAPTKMAFSEDILISVRAPIGAVNYAREECCIGRGLAALTPDKTKVSSEFIFWLLKGKNDELNSKGTGSTFKAIGRKVLEETKVPNIPLEKQLECSEILEKVYAVIQHRKSEIQMMDDLIKARFVEMFGNPEANEKEWKMNTFGDICTVRQGLQIPISKRLTQYEDDCYEYITVQYLHGGKEREYIKSPKTSVICTQNDILMTRTGNTGMVVTGVDGVFHNNFFLIDFDRNKYDKDFLVQYLKLDII